ncbi:glucokinase [Acidimangrovimonas sediminis]|uniref:glucokinase n=1 Tax=Acidimangrovimonas sediminis TaxID=2056283 RepID=UPI000C809FAA|nr:glucokinase [Acidimangrovimonas sediminis]
MPDLAPDRYVLVADIGGTNTRVALAEGVSILKETIRRFRNADHSGLEEVLTTYLADAGSGGGSGGGAVDCAGACIAVAGPVRDGAASLTNLDWSMDGALLARATRAERVAILNDLQAQGHALGQLGPGALRTILPGAPAKPDAARLVVGVGTGFNAAPVHVTPVTRIVPPAEAGHITLPVRSAADLALAEALGARHGFASVEDALSGRGVEAVYAFTSGGQRKTSDQIMEALEDGSDPAALETATTIVRLFGAVAGDLALQHLPFGGIALCGGMARAFAPHLEPLGFLKAFTDKGRFSEFLKGFPVQVIEDDYAALTGCAAYLASQG